MIKCITDAGGQFGRMVNPFTSRAKFKDFLFGTFLLTFIIVYMIGCLGWLLNNVPKDKSSWFFTGIGLTIVTCVALMVFITLVYDNCNHPSDGSNNKFGG